MNADKRGSETQRIAERNQRSSAFISGLLSVLVLTASTLHAADNWPQFRGNPSLTGIATSSVPKTLRLLWTFEAGDSIESSAAIVDGTVYVGSQTSELIAVNLADGKLKWKYKVMDGIGESSPAVQDGVVVVGDLSGVVHGVSAQDGKGIWTFAASSEVKASPVIVDGKAIIGSYNGNLYALGLKDGKVAWQFRTNGPVHATASIAAGLAHISGCDGVLRGIRISDGKEMVQIKTGSYTGASPALSADATYFGTFDNVVLAFNLKTKKPLWQYENPARPFPFYSSAAVVGGKIILGGREDGKRIVECADQVAGRIVAGRSRRAGVHRIERRQVLRARRIDRRKAVGI